MNKKHQDIIDFVRGLYQTTEFIPLHEPKFVGNEKAYVVDCIDSTFVSSVGKYVDRFELEMAKYTGAKYAVATVNGTAALHITLKLAGVNRGDEVITQSLSFVATCNAISYCGAEPVFIDVDRDTLGLSPQSLSEFLSANTTRTAEGCINKTTGRRIAAVVPMHTFGHPCRIDKIAGICEEFGIPLVEDAAESLGSYYQGKHTGTFGKLAAFSFNGNKTITTGGGGMIITDDEVLAKRAKHITTTAKKPHPYEFIHDEIGYNYRLPNINAALGCAQMECLPRILESKRVIASAYADFFATSNITFVKEPAQASANYWLNALVLEDKQARDVFLKELNEAGVMSRPIWRLMNELPMFESCQSDALVNAKWLEDRVVNIPSSARVK
ncbi:LegC family aminotransferase [Devosia sp.]|uniref:LegC family aminotransferase n=1 Tax=Devosia sp. TaxID=1871048 RepID=UPI0027368163|nr:LegC family aminotransferase [Devosia sp.]MDP2782317.1 LegC family aminotransferase [Devosia sp.]